MLFGSVLMLLFANVNRYQSLKQARLNTYRTGVEDEASSQRQAAIAEGKNCLARSSVTITSI